MSVLIWSSVIAEGPTDVEVLLDVAVLTLGLAVAVLAVDGSGRWEPLGAPGPWTRAVMAAHTD